MREPDRRDSSLRRADFAIVADDLTGAADSGVCFARNGYRTEVSFFGERPEGRSDVLVLDTDSRAENESEARRRITAAGRYARDARIVFGKMDSTLRGDLATTIDALLHATERERAVVAPAFPPGGRTTVGGVQLLHGIPVHETDFARDPKNPVAQSDLTHILASVGPVAMLGVSDLGDAGKVQAAFTKGRCVVADATENGHLAALVGAVPDPSEVLWVGSAGLAGALAGTYPWDRPRAAQDFAASRVLAVVGSLSRVSREQVRFVGGEGRAVELVPGDVGATVSRVNRALDGGDVVLHSPEPDGALSSAEVTAALAEVVFGLRGSFDALVLTGGDTAVGVGRRLGATGMEVYGEVEDGVPFGRLVGAVGYPVVTKAGGFGGPETLSRAMGFLGGESG